MPRFICLFVIVLAASESALGQIRSKAIVIGEEVTIRSELLDEEIGILVGTPDGYDAGGARYPVVYLLDGPTHFHQVTGITRLLADNQFAPGALVIGIRHANRARDLTEPPNGPPDGRADAFRAFIATELMPWVERTYRTHPYRTLVGHSLSGRFVIDSLIARPELFNAYVAISPSLQSTRAAERAEAFFAKVGSLKASLFVTSANEVTVSDTGRAIVGGIKRLSGVLDEKAPLGLEHRVVHLPSESHESATMPGIRQGLEFVFSGWNIRNPLEVFDQFGIGAIDRFYQRSTAKYGLERGVPEFVIAGLVRPLLQSGRFEETADVLVHYRGVFRPSAGMLENLAQGFRQRGNRERAIEWYRQALKVNPASKAAIQALAELGG
jgi:predicted alpha/beta superfamily hydrolase